MQWGTSHWDTGGQKLHPCGINIGILNNVSEDIRLRNQLSDDLKKYVDEVLCLSLKGEKGNKFA